MVNYVIAIPSYKRSETLKSKTLAMLKSNKINSKKIHVFVANNEEYRRHSGSSEVPLKILRDYYFPAFKSCIVDAKAQSIMTAYNALNGIPCTMNDFLLKDVLRGEWEFPGWVVSDCGAVYDVHINHKFVKDLIGLFHPIKLIQLVF